MALIDSAECGKKVSTLAATCPSCGAPVHGGAPLKVQKEPIVTSGLLGRIAAVLGAWVVAPWLVRLVAVVAGITMMIVMFRSSR